MCTSARVVAIAVALIAALGCAHRMPRNIREVRGGGPRPAPVAVTRARVLDANESFTHPTVGCTYSATLQGHIDEMRYGSAGEPFGALTFAPRVTVDERIECPDGATLRSIKSFESEDLSAERLTEDLGRAATFGGHLGTRRCTFTPVFGLAADRLALMDVESNCR